MSRPPRTLAVAVLLACAAAMPAQARAVEGAVTASGASQVGLVAWWTANGTARDLAGNHPSRLRGDTTYAPGVFHQSFAFDGFGDSVTSPDTPDWTLRDRAFTLALFVRIDSAFYRQSFLGHDEGGGERRKWIFWYDAQGHREPGGPAIRFHINSPTLGPLDPLVYPWQPVPGRWYHLALTRSANTPARPSVYRLYVNGSLVASQRDGHRIPDPAAPLRLGHSEETFFLGGGLDEVMFFHRRLDAPQIQQLFARSAGSRS